MKKNLALNKVIDKVGSMTKLAESLGVSTSYVSHWASGRKKIPIKYIKKIIKISDNSVKREDLRPDVYDD